MTKPMNEQEMIEFKSNFSKSMEEYNVIQKERAKKFRTIDDKEFRDNLDVLFNSCLSHLRGEYQLYTVYENSNETPPHIYALVYAEYYEKDFDSREHYNEILKEDARFLAMKLKESGLMLQYYFIVPYFNLLNGDSVVMNGNAILTHELD